MFGNIWRAHDSNPWQNNFINGIQIHDQSPWFEPIAIYLSKAQFSLATSKPNSHWQHQSLILIDNIKTQFSSVISKAQLTLALLKAKLTTWHYLSKAQGYQYLVKYYIIIISLKSSIMNNTLDP